MAKDQSRDYVRDRGWRLNVVRNYLYLIKICYEKFSNSMELFRYSTFCVLLLSHIISCNFDFSINFPYISYGKFESITKTHLNDAYLNTENENYLRFPIPCSPPQKKKGKMKKIEKKKTFIVHFIVQISIYKKWRTWMKIHLSKIENLFHFPVKHNLY